mmetsp:Transcript_24727/g.32286  ORF Transcript_24727/g.32286 Transcript_24727/m.32286 type:complete len:340 (+) Transcript_24727:117-1136(+)
MLDWKKITSSSSRLLAKSGVHSGNFTFKKYLKEKKKRVKKPRHNIDERENWRLISLVLVCILGLVAPILQIQKYCGKVYISPNELQTIEISTVFCASLQLSSSSGRITAELYDRSVVPEVLSMTELKDQWDIQPAQFQVRHMWLMEQSTISVKYHSRRGMNLLIFKGVQAYTDFAAHLDLSTADTFVQYFSYDNLMLDELVTIPEGTSDTYFFVYFNPNTGLMSDVSSSLEVYQPSFPSEQSLALCRVTAGSRCSLPLEYSRLQQIAITGPSLKDGEDWHQFDLSYQGVPRLAAYVSVFGFAVAMVILVWCGLEYLSKIRWRYDQPNLIVIKKGPPFLP